MTSLLLYRRQKLPQENIEEPVENEEQKKKDTESLEKISIERDGREGTIFWNASDH